MKNRVIQKAITLIFENPKIFKFFQERLLPKKYTKFKKELVKKYADMNAYIVDFACGIGNMSEAIPDHIDSYVGIDINEKSIETAKKLYPKRRFIVVEKGEIPIKEKVGTIICFSIFHHLSNEELERALIQFKKVLISGGKVIITDQVPWRNQKTLLNKLMVRCDIGNFCRTPEEFREYFKRYFTIEKSETANAGTYICQYHILSK